MSEIKYLKGDATEPIGERPKIICHIVNNCGKWGKGFVVALSNKWPHVRDEYLNWFKNSLKNDFRLGATQFVNLEKGLLAANMVAQHGIAYRESDPPPIRYEKLADCLEEVGRMAQLINAEVVGPRIGCGLARGDWSKIEPLIREHICKKGVQVTIYDYE